MAAQPQQGAGYPTQPQHGNNPFYAPEGNSPLEGNGYAQNYRTDAGMNDPSGMYEGDEYDGQTYKADSYSEIGRAHV